MERQIDVGDTHIHVAVEGEGEPVLLLTGFAGIGAAWGPQIARVAAWWQAIVADHRGTCRRLVDRRGDPVPGAHLDVRGDRRLRAASSTRASR